MNHLSARYIGQINQYGSFSTNLVSHAPNRLKTGCISLIWQNFVGRKVLTPRQKKCRGVRADEVLTLGETISVAYIGDLGGTEELKTYAKEVV